MSNKDGLNKALEVTFNEGDIIIEEGRFNDSAYRILDGVVEVKSEGKHGAITLAELSTNSIFGEMSLVDDELPSATVKAVTVVRLIRFDLVTFKNELHQASPILRELMSIFINRLRKADNTMVMLSDAEKQQRQIAIQSKEELVVSSVIAQTGIKLQNVFIWQEAYKIIENSLLELGFTGMRLQIEENESEERDNVNLKEMTTDGDYYEMNFHGVKQSGRLCLFAPSRSMKGDYVNIFMIYNGLLSSCLTKTATNTACRGCRLGQITISPTVVLRTNPYSIPSRL